MLNLLLVSPDESLYRTAKNICNGTAKVRKCTCTQEINGSLRDSDVILFDAGNCSLENELLHYLMNTGKEERIIKFFIAVGASIDPDFLARHYSAGFEICLQKNELASRLPSMLRAIKRAQFY